MGRSISLSSTMLVLIALARCGSDSGGGYDVPLAPGEYDFYGTFSDNPEYADGMGRCAIPEPVGCPSVTSFCITKLRIEPPDRNGIQTVTGCSEDPENPAYTADCESNSWNVAVGKIYMMPFVVSDWDGGGQVVGAVDNRGGRMDSASTTMMAVERAPTIIPSWMITSWSTSLDATPAGPPGTVVLTIPYRNNLKPPPPKGSPPGTYSPPASTTDVAVCEITNPESGMVTKAAQGTPLLGGRARLVTPHSILRTVIAGLIPMGSDVMSVTTWDGTFCRRDDPAESCVPAYFPCPALAD